jgi:hypothetical protein
MPLPAEFYHAAIKALDLGLTPDRLAPSVAVLRRHPPYASLTEANDCFAIRTALLFDLLPRRCFQDDEPLKRRIAAEHLRSNHGLSDRESAILANLLLLASERLVIDRKTVAGRCRELLRTQHGRCAHCRQSLRIDRESVNHEYFSQDVFKPYAAFPDLLDPEVDHIEPVSLFGSNDVTNLQVVCRLCNSGKGDGQGIRPQLIRACAATLPGSEITPEMKAYLCALVYYTILRSNRCCESCGSGSAVLTIRVCDEDAMGFVPNNVRTVCRDCAGLSP